MGEFEWDDAKARRNLEKHGVSFEAAQLVFNDIFAVEHLDFRGERPEERFVTTGLVNGALLTVVYTERGERIRIISARKATTHEQEEYYRSQTAE